MQLLRLVLYPWWILQLFGTAKSFKDNPVLGSEVLNRLGLHAARYAIGHGITGLRRLMLTPLASSVHRSCYRENGFVVIRDVLPPAEFERLREEMARCFGPQFPGQMRECVQGDAATRMMLLDSPTLSHLPAARALLGNRRIRGVLMYVAAQLKRPLFMTNTVHHGGADGGTDPQKGFHSDTFHSTMKAWYFVSDVTLGDGPFTYVPGSHRFSRARLAWEYAQSILGSGHQNRYSSKGSLRLSEEDRVALGYGEPVQFTVAANTLVIADTHGFHRRGDAPEGAVRVAIYASSRSNPFNPLPGLLPGIAGWIEEQALKLGWRLADRKAAAVGGLPSWRIVSPVRLGELQPSVKEALLPKQPQPVTGRVPA